jgi:hypothetical protein
VCWAVLGFSEEPLVVVLKTKLERFSFFNFFLSFSILGLVLFKKKVPVMVLADLLPVNLNWNRWLTSG